MTVRSRLTMACGIATLLACAPLTPLFDSFRWLGYAVLAVATVTGTSVAARRVAVPDMVIPIVNLAALALLVSMVFGAGTHRFGVLPTGDTLTALEMQVNAAFIDIGQLAVPVPARRGLLLLTVLGVGTVAIAVEALAVSLRRAPLSGLPMLAMFAVPVAVVRTGLGWFPFAVAAAGYLLLLLSEERDRISRWGRPFAETSSGHTWRPDALEGLPMAAAGRRIGAVVIGSAVVLPSLVPFVQEGGLAGLASNGSGRGVGSAQALNPITQLRGQLRRSQPVELLRIKTGDRKPFYLRVTTLDEYTATGWQQDPLSSATAKPVKADLPSPGFDAGVPTKKVSTQVDIRGLGDSQYLPVYAVPTEVDVKGDWRYDPRTGTVFTTRTNTRDLAYSFSAMTLDQSSPLLPELLRKAPESDEPRQARYGLGSVPDESKVEQQVRKIVSGKVTPYDRTLALYDYFRDPKNGFTYSTSTEPGNSGNDLIDFLTNKKGYCEQYASAMAAMARYAGLPARVAIGYTKGAQKRGYWSVTTDDAHAWVEVHFQGVGWVAWDPTPLSGQGRAATLDYTSPPTAVPGQSPGTAATTGPSASGAPGPQRSPGNLGLRGVGPDIDGAGFSAVQPRRDHTVWWLVGVLCLVALLVPSLARLWLRRRRLRRVAGADPRGAAHAAWSEVLASAHDLGLAPNGAETPRVTATRLVRQSGMDDSAGAAVGILARAEERARYARTARPDQRLPQAVRQVRRALSAASGRRARLRACLAPTSVISVVSRQSELGTASVLSSIDGRLARARRVVLGRVVPGRSG